jgi:Zn-dependent protease
VSTASYPEAMKRQGTAVRCQARQEEAAMSRSIVAALQWGIPILVALLCLAGSWLWLLGIPGDESAAYARPWLIGLISVVAYPAVVALILIALALSRIVRLARSGRPFLISLWAALLSFVLVQALVWFQMLSTS